ncbi:MAG: heavy-metal-associated protein [Herminiimonas sp.]|nr:heavy-metal-associated protein [Herminiimonas sp.]
MYELKVNGMSCGGCANSVRRTVQAIDASAKVDVDLPTKTVRVATTASLEAISAAITEAGYPVTASTAL